jgi:threonylcarbamoyladenosine tRNA methylthiotransferase MtaB
MPQVDRRVVKERAARLREVGTVALNRHLDGWVGRASEALIEREGFARLPDFTQVLLGPPASSPAGDRGPSVRLRFTAHDGQHLIGTAA